MKTNDNGLAYSRLRLQYLIARGAFGLFLFLACVANAGQSGPFAYAINQFGDTNTVTITGYSGGSRNVVIPDTLDGMTVTSIGNSAFFEIGSLFGYGYITTISLPSGLTNLESAAFNDCTGLLNFTVDPQNPTYSDVGGVLYNKGEVR